ncbi:inactive transglutaminase family protein [Simiduia curdlanivorans]|uniref:Inactive transglutaminase family protein n=1 Tax=Simiduia curdlanivorans TaxID=1492769 RepID=A0ABV8V411_9GAMM|nr:inactive transglutaminase family protein [Simiduia curdlanivorans]MDN3640848.1 inactive transglutaminase family protein [Simiduia curdlanivorans]
MKARFQLYVVAAILAIVGLSGALYKNLNLGFPLWPGESKNVWTLQSKIDFQPSGDPIEVTLALPEKSSNGVIIDENFSSSGFGFVIFEEGEQRYARWTRREAPSKNVISLNYKLQVVHDNSKLSQPNAPEGEVEKLRTFPSERESLRLMLDRLSQESATDASFTQLMLGRLNAREKSQDVAYLLSVNNDQVMDVAFKLLSYKGIHFQTIKGLQLEDGRRRANYSELLEIYSNGQWIQFNPTTGEKGLPSDFLIWQRGGISLLDVIGGINSKVEFSMVVNTVPARTVAMMQDLSNQAALIDMSIYSLPVEQQGVFKTLLLIPIGALVVVFLRIIVGLPTSGTFMPILIALAFIETGLLAGLPMFILVVGVGLWIRYYLSHLNLLLVARVSAVIIVVIGLMAFFSIASYKLGIVSAMSVTFFPTIILAWTIERMSTLWEEEGPRDVVKQGGGSLLVAVIAYGLMTNSIAKHLTFNFPELSLVLLALILVIGQYNGYRLSELYRFRHMVFGQKAQVK